MPKIRKVVHHRPPVKKSHPVEEPEYQGPPSVEPSAPEPDLAAENAALRAVLEHAAKFMMVRDQESFDALKKGLLEHNIISNG
jgi:hypothetical protein